MVPTLFVYALGLIALVWLFLMLCWLGPNATAVQRQPIAPAQPRRRKRSPASQTAWERSRNIVRSAEAPDLQSQPSRNLRLRAVLPIPWRSAWANPDDGDVSAPASRGDLRPLMRPLQGLDRLETMHPAWGTPDALGNTAHALLGTGTKAVAYPQTSGP